MKINDRTNIYEFLKRNLIMLLFYFSIILFLMITGIRIYQDDKQKAQDKHNQIVFENQKYLSLIKTKQSIVCNGILYKPEQYDLVKLNDTMYIETYDKIDNPKPSIKLSNCLIYDKRTTTIIPEVKETADELLVKENERLVIANKIAQQTNIAISTELTHLRGMIAYKDNEIKKLTDLVENKQKTVEELYEYKIKYNEIRGLLQIALVNTSDKMQKAFDNFFKQKIPDQSVSLNTKQKEIIEPTKKTEFSTVVENGDIQNREKYAHILVRNNMIKQIAKINKSENPSLIRSIFEIDPLLMNSQINKIQINNFEIQKNNLDMVIHKLLRLVIQQNLHLDYETLSREIFNTIESDVKKFIEN